MVDLRINWTLCTDEIRKPRQREEEHVYLFFGSTIVAVLNNSFLIFREV